MSEKKPYGFTITVQGRNFLAKQVAGEQLNISRVMVGSGIVPEDTNLVYLTDLVQPVAQATSTYPIAEKDTVSFIVEYRNDLNGGLKEGFWLREFGVFARDGEDEILIYYATLGDFPQFVIAYRDGVVDIRRYPVTLKISDKIDIKLEYPALAFVTEEKLRELLEKEAIPYLERIIKNSTIQRDIMIPATAWMEEIAEGGGGGVCANVEQKDVTDEMIPIVSIFRECMSIARNCGMSTTAETVSGGVKFYAEKAPEQDIRASLLLLRASGGSGTYINNMASDEEVQEMLNEVFGSKTDENVEEQNNEN